MLEIDGRRRFPYGTVYFDTGELRSFHEHAAGAVPRFKARTRHYVAAGDCVFEIKLKMAEGKTDKHHAEHAAVLDDLDATAMKHLASTLDHAGIEPPARLEPVLRTRFDRVTLAYRDGSARMTIDFDVTLERPRGNSVTIRDGLVLVEPKSEDGDAPADRALRSLGVHGTRCRSTGPASTPWHAATPPANWTRSASSSLDRLNTSVSPWFRLHVIFASESRASQVAARRRRVGAGGRPFLQWRRSVEERETERGFQDRGRGARRRCQMVITRTRG